MVPTREEPSLKQAGRRGERQWRNSTRYGVSAANSIPPARGRKRKSRGKDIHLIYNNTKRSRRSEKQKAAFDKLPVVSSICTRAKKKLMNKILDKKMVVSEEKDKTVGNTNDPKNSNNPILSSDEGANERKEISNNYRDNNLVVSEEKDETVGDTNDPKNSNNQFYHLMKVLTNRLSSFNASSPTTAVSIGRYSAIYTDGSKRADYVGCGVVIEDIMHGYRLDTSCSIFTAEAVAIYRALQLIDSTMPRKYCIYTDSMSVLEALENYHDRCHPVVCTILDITSRLYSKGFDIVFCWLPSHVGIIGNEQADSAAKSATTHLPLAVPLSDMKRVIMHHIFKIWQESWSQQLDNKLHSVKPVIGAWPVMPMRRTDVKLTRLRIGHTRFTHRHLLFGERAPECPSCHVSYTVHHILIHCPVFNNYRITFFNSSHLTLPDLVGEIPHQNLFAFIRRIRFLYLI
ncbi:RNase H domain-containing protein [Trichonephila clavipes]|uniref:ribonuclease H n=1 Tax=Trichonephila clavipes TaxID=2585209 RepID=A0A8X6W564_TRICX|nr:RNase H domain-containing protein [Trichonephila clavipes]